MVVGHMGNQYVHADGYGAVDSLLSYVCQNRLEQDDDCVCGVHATDPEYEHLLFDAFFFLL